MARGRKAQTESTTEVKEKELDIREQLANKRREESLKRKEVMSKFRDSKNIMVEVMNNSASGDVKYVCKVTGTSFEMGEFGQTEPIPLDTLKSMVNKKSRMIFDYWIIPIDIYSDDETITLEEALEYLKVKNLYTGEMFNEDNIDYMILQTKTKQLESVLKSYDEKYKQRMVERALELIKSGELNDSAKQRVFERISTQVKEAVINVENELAREEELEDEE